MNTFFAMVMTVIFGGLFLLGAGTLCAAAYRDPHGLPLARGLIVLILFFPFLLYVTAGAFGVRFGWARNFFYLEPLYLMCAFVGLKVLIPAERSLRIGGALLLVLLLISSVCAPFSWRERNLERDMIRAAVRADADLVILSSDVLFFPHNRWPLHYYLNRYGPIAHPIVITRKTDSAGYLAVVRRFPAVRRIVIIEDIGPGVTSTERVACLQNELKERMTLVAFVRDPGPGPYRFLQRLFRYPPHDILRTIFSAGRTDSYA